MDQGEDPRSYAEPAPRAAVFDTPEVLPVEETQVATVDVGMFEPVASLVEGAAAIPPPILETP